MFAIPSPQSGKGIHFIGIGGTGLSAIARLLLEMGYPVTGSDRVLSPLAKGLQESRSTCISSVMMPKMCRVPGW